MKLKIYNETWDIKEVSQEELQKLHDDVAGKYSYWGSCAQYENIIYILKDLGTIRKRAVLLHEITHAVSSIHLVGGNIDEEYMCNFVSAHYDEIGKVVKEYMKPKKKRQRVVPQIETPTFVGGESDEAPIHPLGDTVSTQ